ncbi:hypothetical protein WKK05_19580 [Nostoc sp. UHCC 0302]|uniref:hypothetical protein n=1 Tax=Nostoc sp. UHCC 0302 TaxID=3134896 RepID=UPI00311CB961
MLVYITIIATFGASLLKVHNPKNFALSPVAEAIAITYQLISNYNFISCHLNVKAVPTYIAT